MQLIELGIAFGHGTKSVSGLSNEHKGEDDASLVLLSKRGDTEAFESLVRKYEKRMYNVALRITGNPEDAVEAVQDAFVSAFSRLGGFKGEARFSTWLYRIAVNASLNRLKAARNEPVSLEGRPEAEGVNAETALHGVQRKELQQAVHDCIGRLEPGFREVVVLRDLEGFSYDEIADTLDIKGGTVRSRLSRAREALRECLKGVIDEVR